MENQKLSSNQSEIKIPQVYIILSHYNNIFLLLIKSRPLRVTVTPFLLPVKNTDFQYLKLIMLTFLDPIQHLISFHLNE